MARKLVRFVFILLTISYFVLLVINGVASDTGGRRKLRVVTTFYPMYIMAVNVCKDVPDLELTNLTSADAGCLHDYALTTTDMGKLESADIIIANGAGMESFLVRISRRYPRLKIVELAQGLPLIKNSAGPNPHVWVSVSRAIDEVRNLIQFMARIDADHALLYKKNGENYIGRLKALRSDMHAALAAYRGTPIVTFHEAFPYFAEEFGLKITAVIDREPGSAPSAKELAGTIRTIRKYRVKALFTEPQYPAAPAVAISRETGVRLSRLDPAVTGPDVPDAYIDIMRENLSVLQRALR